MPAGYRKLQLVCARNGPTIYYLVVRFPYVWRVLLWYNGQIAVRGSAYNLPRAYLLTKKSSLVGIVD